jgi:23S rRNA (guanosine2251-2'-O)-methyltransferase
MHPANCSMYNDLMGADSYEIRVCSACGLRYPLVDSQAETVGRRCPACLGETRLALNRDLATESTSSWIDGTGNASRSPSEKRKLAVLLDNIRSAWNVGSIFRSADGFALSHAYLCGITPTPDNDAVQKTSLGAEETVTWTYHKDAVKLANGLKKEGWRLLALEDDERAVTLESDRKPLKGREATPRLQILIVGNEVTGVDPELLNLSDTIYCIPMQGDKRSFNVAIAFGIAAYTLSR